MLEAEPQSNLAIIIERENVTDKGMVLTPRDLDIHYKDPLLSGDIKQARVKKAHLAIIGKRVAIVPRYNQEQFNQLDVDAIITVDAPGLLLDEPVIIERDLPGEHDVRHISGEKDQSDEMILIKRGDFTHTLDKFHPREKQSKRIGTSPVGPNYRLTIQDVRPKPATEVPSLESPSRL